MSNPRENVWKNRQIEPPRMFLHATPDVRIKVECEAGLILDVPLNTVVPMAFSNGTNNEFLAVYVPETVDFGGEVHPDRAYALVIQEIPARLVE